MKSIGGSSRRSDVVFFESGRIDISSHVVRLLGIKRGDVVDLVEDERSGYLYLYVKQSNPDWGRWRGRVSMPKRGCLFARVNSVRLSRYVCRGRARVEAIAGEVRDVQGEGRKVELIIREGIEKR